MDATTCIIEEPQKKYCLGTVSNRLLLGLNMFYLIPTRSCLTSRRIDKNRPAPNGLDFAISKCVVYTSRRVVVFQVKKLCNDPVLEINLSLWVASTCYLVFMVVTKRIYQVAIIGVLVNTLSDL